jgi:hypothetical protein
MPRNCTILCPSDEPQQILHVLRGLIQVGAEIYVTGKESNWSKIDIRAAAATLTLNRQFRRQPGDSFSKMVLGMHNYFNQVKTSAQAIKKNVLDRVAKMRAAIGVVAKPEFVDETGHYDCIIGIAAAVDAIIWTGRGVINPEGKMILDGEGKTEVA